MTHLENLKEISFKFQPKRMAALPGITKQDREIIKYGGVDFYTNEKLRQKFIMSLLKHTPTKAHKTIIDLINKKIIIPVFLTKSTFSWYLKNQRDPEQDEKFSGVYGFYTIKDKKIFILIDAGYKVLGWVPDHHLAGVTLHECMHMASKKNPTKFMRVNAVPLYKYYSVFLNYVFLMKDDDKKTILDWILYIHGFEIQKHGLDGKKYREKLMAAAKASRSTLSDEEIENRAKYITSYAFGTYGVDESKLLSIIRSYKNVYHGLMIAYQKAFRFRAKTTAYQELFTVSEVICMLASMELGKNRYVSDSLDILL